MADIAASVLARLKNKSKESGRSYQLCLQLFCQEEFLRRLEKSKYAENLVLKGGLFIYSVTEARRFPDTVTEFISASLITCSVSCASSAICATLQIFSQSISLYARYLRLSVHAIATSNAVI